MGFRMAEIVMPRLSDSMTEGTVVKWLCAVGDTVYRGAPIVDIETDKATVTYEADLDGVLAQILIGEGQTVPVGTVIALIHTATEAAAPVAVATDQPIAPLPLPMPDAYGEPAPAEPSLAEPAFTDPSLAEPAFTEPAFTEPALTEPALAEPAFVEPVSAKPALAQPSDVSPAAPVASPAPDDARVKASPIAKRLARKLGIELTSISGSGPGGRIVKEDVEAAANAQAGGLANPQAQVEERHFEPQYAGGESAEFEPVTAAPGLAPQAAQQPQAVAPEPQQITPQPAAVAPPAGPVFPGPGAATAGGGMPVPQQPAYPQGPMQGMAPQSGATGSFGAISPGAPQFGSSPSFGTVPVAQAPAVVGATVTRGQSTTVEPSHAQQVVARRMAEAKATVPEYSIELDVDMTNALMAREQLRYSLQPPPSVNDVIVKATAMALRQYPRVNGAYRDGKFEYYSDVNIGVVVSGGDLLAVPTIFNADQKGLAQIARESHELSAAVRNRTIQPQQLSGGTFSISNLGMFGITKFNAIINTPQAAILAVGAVTRRPVVGDDGFAVQVRQMMTLTLTCDHRILYGHEAAEFLSALKSWLESPQSLQV